MSDLNLLNDSATDLGAAGFGLMFYRVASRAKRVGNARWPRSVPVAKRRGYDPMTGRFAQADSIVPGGVQGLDRYAYTSNNPIRYIDPSGHSQSDSQLSPEEIAQLLGFQSVEELYAWLKENETNQNVYNLLIAAAPGDIVRFNFLGTDVEYMIVRVGDTDGPLAFYNMLKSGSSQNLDDNAQFIRESSSNNQIMGGAVLRDSDQNRTYDYVSGSKFGDVDISPYTLPHGFGSGCHRGPGVEMQGDPTFQDVMVFGAATLATVATLAFTEAALVIEVSLATIPGYEFTLASMDITLVPVYTIHPSGGPARP